MDSNETDNHDWLDQLDQSIDSWGFLNIDLDLGAALDPSQPYSIAQLDYDNLQTSNPILDPPLFLNTDVPQFYNEPTNDHAVAQVAGAENLHNAPWPGAGHQTEDLTYNETSRDSSLPSRPPQQRDQAAQTEDPEAITRTPRQAQGGTFITFSLTNRPVKAYKKRCISEKRRKEIGEMRQIGSCVLCKRYKRSCDKGQPCGRCSRLAPELCVRENLPTKAVCHTYSEAFTKHNTEQTLKTEIGRWTGERGKLQLVPLWGRSIASPKLDESFFLSPFNIDVEYYLPPSSSTRLMWYSFQAQKWFYPPDMRRAAIRSNTALDIEKLASWACGSVGDFLRDFPCWRSVFIFHESMMTYAEQSELQPLPVKKANQLRALAFLLKSSLASQEVREDGHLERWSIPRAIYFQIKGILQQACAKIEKELLNFLQQSLFDPKRRDIEALPNLFVTIALLSTYSILGTCYHSGQMHHNWPLIDALTFHHYRAYAGYQQVYGEARSQAIYPTNVDVHVTSSCALFGSIENLRQMIKATSMRDSTLVASMFDHCQSLKTLIKTKDNSLFLDWGPVDEGWKTVKHFSCIRILDPPLLEHRGLGRGLVGRRGIHSREVRCLNY